MFEKTAERIRQRPFATISTIVGTLSGIIAIIAFAGTVIDKVDERIISPEELAGTEQRIIQSLKSEAVLTRKALLSILDVRKIELQEEMERHEASGRTVQAQAVLDELRKLKKQITEIRDAQ